MSASVSIGKRGHQTRARRHTGRLVSVGSIFDGGGKSAGVSVTVDLGDGKRAWVEIRADGTDGTDDLYLLRALRDRLNAAIEVSESRGGSR